MERSKFTKLRVGYENFCNGTSMHGFAELVNSYSVFWKVFWFVTCFGSCAVSVYLVCESVNQYITTPTSTTSSTVDEKDMFYPSLRLCFWQWFYWVNWTLAAEYPNDALLYGMHFINGIFADDTFNLTNGQTIFEQMMADKGYNSLYQFYKSVARTVPIYDDNSLPPFSPYFDDFEILFYDRTTYHMFCFKVSESNMYRYFQENNNTKKTIAFSVIDETFYNFSQFLTPPVYTQYMLRWANRIGVYEIDTTQEINLTMFEPTRLVMLFSDISRALEMNTDDDAYQMDVSACAFEWLLDDCTNSFQSVKSNSSCYDKCQALADVQQCTCLRIHEAILANLTFTQNVPVCYKDVSVVETQGNDSLTNMTVTIVVNKTMPNCTNTSVQVQRMQTTCNNQCAHSCTLWNFEKSITVKPSNAALKKLGTKNSTRVFIKYPSGTDVIMMTEVDVQGWETFVGNVGGILGIWTGASVVSFVQMIYLCCFAEDDKAGNCSSCCARKNQTEPVDQETRRETSDLKVFVKS